MTTKKPQPNENNANDEITEKVNKKLECLKRVLINSLEHKISNDPVRIYSQYTICFGAVQKY